MTKNGIDLSHIYSLRDIFTVVGLTGQTGSGCKEVADLLSKGFGNGEDFENPSTYGRTTMGYLHNSYRKHRIVYDYAKQNFKPFTQIKYKDVLTLFLIKYELSDLVNFLASPELAKEFVEKKLPAPDFKYEIDRLQLLKQEFKSQNLLIRKLDLDNIQDPSWSNWDKLYDFYFSQDFDQLSVKIHKALGSKSALSCHKTLQVAANNIRRSGSPFKFSSFHPEKIFYVAETINKIIKSIRKRNDHSRTQVVINSLKNPFEIMYFKQRFSAFYAIAINRSPSKLDLACKEKFRTPDSWDDAKKVLEEEYKGGKDSEFYKQNVEECYQQADVHINFLSTKEASELNQNLKPGDNTTPYFSWCNQLLKYISLISHPGLVTPSPEERCMQLAYTAKHNSGCISRHVGAAITDEFYSVKAIGWNNTPEGQVPCVLRNAEDLLNLQNDIDAFTPYEQSPEFRDELSKHYKELGSEENQKNLKGRNVCFCFKSLKNSFSEGKNQVHTRSLHAEESAFLQITKYGGVGIKNGKLFSTASPCELCSKKAYQLGIKIIYYIDPYPGISTPQILSAGTNPIEVRLFNGAIGNAYHWLYDPIMPYKDEQTLVLGNPIQDLVKKHEEKIKDHEKKIKKQEAEIADLKAKLSAKNNV